MSDVIEEIKKQYEIGFLVPSEESAPELVAMLKRYEADITNEGTLKRIRLAYPIKKETSAVFGYFHFKAEPEKAKALEQDLRTNSMVIRSIIVRLPKPSKKGSGSGEGKSARPSATAARPATEQKVAPSLSNEALEKKIEEILQ